MVVQWIVGLFTGLGSWVGSLFPDWTPPAFLSQAASQVNNLLAQLNGVGVWVDWTYILIVVSGVLLTWVITLGVKTVRALASYVPFFGGAG